MIYFFFLHGITKMDNIEQQVIDYEFSIYNISHNPRDTLRERRYKYQRVITAKNKVFSMLEKKIIKSKKTKLYLLRLNKARDFAQDQIDEITSTAYCSDCYTCINSVGVAFGGGCTLTDYSSKIKAKHRMGILEADKLAAVSRELYKQEYCKGLEYVERNTNI